MIDCFGGSGSSESTKLESLLKLSVISFLLSDEFTDGLLQETDTDTLCDSLGDF